MVIWENAPDIKKRLLLLTRELKIDWLDTAKIFCFRSSNAKTRAYARIWGLSRIWQQALELRPAYILEVISEKYEKLSPKQKDKILLHELVHIPKNFSGALIPHTRRGKRSFRGKFHALHGKLKILHEDYRFARRLSD